LVIGRGELQEAVVRFSTRDLLWLTVVAALVAGWSVDRFRQSRREDALRKEVRDLEAVKALAEM
jgi:hypothetical protein